MEPKRRKAEISEATRSELLAVAQEMFAERGFADTATEEVVARAGVTRGALYYHFANKEGLFRAVVEEVERATAEKVALAALGVSGSWDQLIAGCRAFLDACTDPAVRRISLLDGPSVLGWDTYREIDLRYGLGLLRAGLTAAMEAGELPRQPPDPLAHLILGALIEAAMLIGRAPDEAAPVVDAFVGLLEGMRAR